MKYKLADLVNIPELQELMDIFYEIAEAPTAILEADGTVLTATAWQPICTEFHRVCPALAERCTESDVYIADHLDEGAPYVAYECANGLVDVAAPVIVAGEHVGTVFTGQFLFEEPDIERFRKQAQEFDLDEEAYLEALAEVPIVSREQLEPLLTYLSRFAEMLADMGLQRLQQLETQRVLAESEARYQTLTERYRLTIQQTGQLIYDYNIETGDIQWAGAIEALTGYTPEEFAAIDIDAWAEHIHPEDRDQALALLDEATEQAEPYQVTYRFRRKDGSYFYAEDNGGFLVNEDGKAYRMLGAQSDITERRQAQAERERFTTRLETAAEISEQVGSILDPDKLLQAVIPLIKERFGLYYVHVYTLSEDEGMLNLRAGYGKPGRIMVEQGHSIPLDREASLVATAARSKEPVLVNDVSQNPNFMPNELLPDTKSEVAVPAIAGGKVLGVFDVQHDEVDYFTNADLDVFLTLAAQIATTFQNAQTVERLNLTQASVDRAGDAVFWIDKDANLDYVNNATCERLGYSREELLDMKVFDIDPVFPKEAWPSHWEELQEKKTMTIETVHQAKDGTRYPVEVALNYIEYGDVAYNSAYARDITERQKAEQAIRESEERLSLALEAGRVGIWEFWPQRDEVYYNPTWYTMLGYEAYELPQDLSTWATLLHPEDAPRANQIVMDSIQAGEDFDLQFRMKTKEGDWRWIQAYGYVTERTSEGSAERTIGTHTDITEQKLAQDRLRESQQKFQMVADFTYDWEYWLGPGDEFLYVSPACEKITGYTVDEFMADPKLLDEIVLPEDRELLHQHVDEYHDNPETRETAQEAAEIAFRITTKDGEVRWIAHACQPVYGSDGEWLGRRASNRDATESKQAQEALQRSEAQNRTTIDALVDVLHVIDADYRLLLYNEAFEQQLKALGLKDEEARAQVVGKNLFELFPFLSDKARAQYEQVFETGQPVVTEERNTMEGQDIFTETRKIPVFEDDEVIRCITMIRDITEQKQAEIERERFTTRLDTAAQISEQVGSILDPDELLQTVIPLIKEQFGLYYVHVYTLDEETGMLNLRAGYGEAGETMLAEGHSIPLDREASLVATAARTKQPVLVDDVTENPNFMPNPLLPDTKTEVAVPAIAGGRVLGVFDVQHDEAHYFTQADLDVFQTLAAQIANAFQSAELYEQVERDSMLYDTILTNLPVGVWVADNEFNVLLVNETQQEMIGREIVDRRGDTHTELYDVINTATGKVYNEAAMPIARTMANGGSYTANDLGIRHPDGTVVPVMSTSAPLLNAEEEQIGAIVITTDISEQVAAQEAIQASEARQRTILETTPVGIAITKVPDNTVLYVNPEFSAILGYTEEDLLDKAVPDFYYYEEDSKKAFELMQAQNGVLEDYEVYAKRADGTPLWLSLSIKPITYGDQPALLAAFVDITERKQAEAELNRQVSILENSDDYIAAVDMQGTQIYINQAGAQMLGYDDPNALIGAAIKDAHSPEGTQLVEQVGIPTAMREGVWRGENRLLRRDGTVIPVDQTIFIIRDSQGEPQAIATIMTDITERKQAEAERERFTARLDTAAQISEQVGAILDPDELLQTVIPLIKEQFGLYYVHVYTLDKETGMLNLRAGYGEAGETMLAEGHSIPVDREASLVATAARTKEPVLVDDVTENPNFMPNPLLPDTKTEVAVPSIAGGQVLGVFDVQHDEAHYFTQADLDVFQTLAAQIANAFRSAELYETAENERVFYDGIIENLPVGVWAVDNEFTPLLVNPAGRDMMGREIKDEDGGAYVESYDVINVETGELYDNTELPLVKAVTQGGEHAVVDAGVRHPDGTVVPMLINAAPLYNVEGKQSGAVVIFADATEQRQAQAEVERLLEQTETRLRVSQALAKAQTEDEVLDAMVQAADFYPESGAFLYLVDPNAEEFTLLASRNAAMESGIPPMIEQGTRFPASQFPLMQHLKSDTALVVGNMLEDERVDPASRQITKQMGIISLAILPITAGSEWMGVLITASQQEDFYDERRLYLYRSLADQGGVALQATRLQDAVQQSEARFRILYDNSPVGFVLTDFESGEYLQANQAYLDILGYTLDELNELTYWELTPKEYMEAENEQLRAMQELGRYGPYEKEYIRKDGTRIPTLLNGVVVTDPNTGRKQVWSLVEDITERRAAEQALRANEERLSLALEAGRVGIWEFWPERNEVYYNPTWYTMLGYEPYELPQEVSTWGELLHPDDAERANAAFRGSVTAAKDFDVQFRMQTKEGGWRWIQAYGYVMERTSEDAAERVIGTHTDITEQKLAEDELRTNEERLTLALEAGQVGIWEFWPQRDEVYYNPTWYTMLGYDPYELPQDLSTWAMLLHPDDAERANEIVMGGVQAGEDFHLQFRMKTKYGDWRWIQAHGYVTEHTPDGMAERTIGTHTDITERKLAEDARERFTIRLSTAADIAEQIGSILDPDELLQTVIPLIKEQFGLYYVHVYTLDEETGMLNLRAGYGETGETMLAEGHSIPLDREASLVATAARTKQPVLVDDVTENPNFMPNPLLPDTKTEAAVPSIAGGRVLGVFDVQHDEAHYFTDADVDVFQTLAGQIANAFRSAELLEETAEAQVRFQTVADFTYDWEYWLGPEENLLYVSPACEGITGYSVEEFMQDPSLLTKIVHPDDKDVVHHHIDRYHQDPEKRETAQAAIETEYRIITKDGQVRWIGHACQPVYGPDGEWLGRRASNRDATESVEAQQAVQESQRLLQEFLDNFPDIAFAKDVNGNIILANRQLKESFPTPDGVLLGKTVYDLVPDEVADGVWKSERQVLETGEVIEFEENIPQKDGLHTKLTTKFPLYDAEGNVSAVGGVSIDITERKQAEVELERFAGRLNTAADIAERVGSILDPDELLQTVIPLIKERFDLYYVHVYTLDEETGQLTLRAGYGEPGHIMLEEGHSIPLDREASLVATAARTKKVVHVPDVTENPNFMPNPLLPDTKTEVAVPSIAGGQVMGVFDVQHDETHYFTGADLNVFQTLAGQIANAFRSAELFERVEESLAETGARLRVSQALAEAQTESEVLDAMVRAADFYPQAQILVSLVEESNGGGHIFEAVRSESFESDIPPVLQVGMRFSTKEFPLLEHVSREEGFISNDVPNDERVDPGSQALAEQMGAQSIAILPVVVGNTWMATLTALVKSKDFLDDRKLYLYRSLARQGAEALQAARLRDQLSLTQFSVDHGPAAIYWMRPDASLYDVNETACEMLGYSREELLSIENFTNLDPNFPPEAWAAHWQDLKEKQEMIIQSEHRAKDGHLIPVEIEVNYLKYGDMEFDCAFARDITKRLEAERAVRESEERLRLLIEGVQDYAIITIDSQGYVVSWNEGAQRIKGYTEEEIIGKHFSCFYTEEDQEAGKPQMMMERAQQEGSHEEIGLRVRKDGSTFWADVVITAMYDDQDNLRGFSKVTQDITERREREAALRESEQRFRGLYESSPLGIILNDFESGDYLEANDAFLEMMGYTLEELNQLSYWDITPEKYADDEQAQIRSMEETGKYGPYEKEYIRKDGTVFPVVLNGVVITDNTGRKLIWSTVEDITERVEAEQAVREERDRAQTYLDIAGAIIVALDKQGNITLINEVGCDTLGYRENELLGRNWFEVSLPEEVVDDVVAAFRQITAGDIEPVADYENEIVTRDGETRMVAWHNTLLQDEAGNITGVLSSGLDITERLEAETEREHFTRQLSTSADISAQVNAILDPDELLNEVTKLLKESFDLYHVQFYTLDGREEEALSLRASYGQTGKLMLKQGHKLTLDHPRSLVARAARVRDIVLLNDIDEDPDYLPNPLLPNTRAEVAVPALTSEQVLGVFDIHADEAGAFATSDLDVFRTLAGQIATALQNALLFEQQGRTQAALRDSAERIRAMFEAITDGIAVTNMMGEITDLNEALVRLHGHEQRDELLGRNNLELIAKEDRGKAAESLASTLETGSSELMEYKFLKKDGKAFEGELTAALLRDSEDNPTGFITVRRDITERKEVQRQIAVFQALAENAVDAIAMADLEGQLTYANEACYDLFGYDYAKQNMMGVPLMNFWPEEETSTLREQALPQAMSSGWQGEVSQKRKDDSIFEAALTIFPVLDEDNNPISVAAIIRDITERIEAEQERQRFTNQLSTAADVSARINAILDPQELLEIVVPLVSERFDLYHVHVYTLDEESQDLVMRVGSGEAGRIMREQGHQIPLDQAHSLVARAARTKKPVLVNDVTQAPDFMPNPLLPDTRSEVAVPAVVGGRVVGVFDVQDNKPNRFTEGDINVFSTLAGQIAIALENARNFAEIQATADRLREVDRLKSEFLANMSHELRTPLNSILGYTEVMLMGIDGELDPEMMQDVEAIYDNGQHLLRLINDILDLAKIEAGRMTLNKEDVYLDLLIDEVKTSNIGYLRKMKKPVEFVVTAEEDLPLVKADRVRLSQVLNNLVSNAIKFTDKGHITLHAYQESDDSNKTWVCIDVEDTGMGIAKEDMDKLFERFRQIDGSSTRKAEGTGLGLSITRHLVEMHGGKMNVQSEPGKGSIFTVKLPAYKPTD